MRPLRTGTPTMTNFFDRVAERQKARNSLLCVGLDPDPARLPAVVRRSPQPIFEFLKAIVDATADVASCFKPQIAHFASARAEHELEQLIDYIKGLGIPLLLDAKRGDVGSTAEMYAKELFERYGADAATVNPYLGLDAMAPYLAHKDKGVLILCRTSNEGGADLQNLELKNGKLLFEHVAEKAASEWNFNGNVGLVAGATMPRELGRIRELVGPMTLLLPGIGAQGGDIEASISAGSGGGLIVSSSRAILYADDGKDFAEAARRQAIITRDEINAFRFAA